MVAGQEEEWEEREQSRNRMVDESSAEAVKDNLLPLEDSFLKDLTKAEKEWSEHIERSIPFLDQLKTSRSGVEEKRKKATRRVSSHSKFHLESGQGRKQLT